MSREITCQICNTTSKNNISFSSHLRHNHLMIYKEYYDKFLKEDMDGICLTCDNETTFIRMRYGKFCSNKCNTSNEKLNIERGLRQKETKRNNPEIVKNAGNTRKETMRNNPEIQLNANKNRLKTLEENPEIQRNAKEKEMQTKRDNPEIMKNAGKKLSKTLSNNPEIMKNASKKISISRRNYYKSLQENISTETHCLYIMEHQTKPIIKIGLCLERCIKRRISDLSRYFGESKPVLLLKSTHQKIDEVETFLHDHFKEHCKVQPEKYGGRTEWFDKEIMAEAVELASAKILES